MGVKFFCEIATRFSIGLPAMCRIAFYRVNMRFAEGISLVILVRRYIALCFCTTVAPITRSWSFPWTVASICEPIIRVVRRDLAEEI